LLKGDNNTEFFHRDANGKRRKQTIFTLKSGDRIVTGDDNLMTHATEYYKALFGPPGGGCLDLDQDLCPLEDNVTMKENSDLTKPFQEEEIMRALNQMERNKAAGPDGYPI
jgi:hypothetical protein